MKLRRSAANGERRDRVRNCNTFMDNTII